ncbi:MAG: hypothetical protein ACRDYY_08410 [Acidimicrobiales bacterium]
MRIPADPGGLDSPGFDDITNEVTEAIRSFATALGAGTGAAEDTNLASAISEVSDVLQTADRSAALSLLGLDLAVAKVGRRNGETRAHVAAAAG